MDRITILQKQIDKIEELKATKYFSPEFKAWKRKTRSLLENVFKENSTQVKDFDNIHYFPMVTSTGMPDSYYQGVYCSGLDDAKAILTSMLDEVQQFAPTPVNNDLFSFILEVLHNFYNVERQLRNRYDHRPTLSINDEYDVQDLVHALLKIKIMDIRREECTPSSAGKSARMDIIIKEIETVIEVKMTRNKLRDKEIGDQLIVDIERYKSHPDCKNLICFIYDPHGFIVNPEGLVKDLSGSRGHLNVVVIIKP